MFSYKKYIGVVAAVGAVSTGALSWAQDSTAPKTVEQRLEQLDQEIRILKRQRELEQGAAAAKAEKAKENPVLIAGKDGFGFKSADGNFSLRLRGYVQADGRFFFDDDTKVGTDRFLLRRVRPIVEGTLFKDFAFRIMPDFGGGSTTLQDAYIDWRKWPEFQVRAGKFKPPVGLERLQSGTNLEFVERAFPTGLVPNRDVGVQLSGDFWGGVLQYAGGVFNGVTDGGSGDVDNNDGFDFAGRLFAHPFRRTDIEPLQELGLGFSATWGDQNGSPGTPNLTTYRSQGQLVFFRYLSATPATAANTVVADGDRIRFSPQGYWYWGPFGLLGEYVLSQQEVKLAGATERLEHEAWQIAAYWVVTGEKASFKGVTPRKNFDLKGGGWGALELVGRVQGFDADDDSFPVYASPAASADEAFAWGVGLNWYLNRNVKLSSTYEQTKFDGGAAGGSDRETEKVLFGRIQLVY